MAIFGLKSFAHHFRSISSFRVKIVLSGEQCTRHQLQRQTLGVTTRAHTLALICPRARSCARYHVYALCPCSRDVPTCMHMYARPHDHSRASVFQRPSPPRPCLPARPTVHLSSLSRPCMSIRASQPIRACFPCTRTPFQGFNRDLEFEIPIDSGVRPPICGPNPTFMVVAILCGCMRARWWGRSRRPMVPTLSAPHFGSSNLNNSISSDSNHDLSIIMENGSTEQ
ncbi:hypothetical protein CRG98_012611 [Punica granatum]|uniref:Uncharacterized protein n=1 Tax=Punica granatum TaxID=22663 RepID=A0A2I0KEQ1_PUNGR|nr:hypothetical protein CRG98_012611 [Punica granatum]